MDAKAWTYVDVRTVEEFDQGWVGYGFPIEGAAAAEKTWAQLEGG